MSGKNNQCVVIKEKGKRRQRPREQKTKKPKEKK